ncbi:conserved hypothetical protein [Haliangium ochraceum DSM 14365]|uniref:Glycosyltransferase 2-like domain-containing protein n=1 Tax=Haliangium ochraceum (strain DSM 14365 / JCM 11303 / SMP-2) TaxID=502025 RepID=D0LTW8_HALO1|nr:conserved hypothetical protein [Haliangium ochraceum DSM 14365]
MYGAAVDRVIAQYLARYAAPEAQVATRLARDYAQVCVVPALDESPALLERLGSPRSDGPWLLIVVVNASDEVAEPAHARNAALLRALAECDDARAPARLSQSPPMTLARLGHGDVLCVDRASAGQRLPAGQGVGLARRIGGDIALAAFAAGRLRSRWIHMSDADVALPDDYFAAAERAPAAARALVYPFWHEDSGEREVDLATGLYELYLRYHRLGLRWAGSAYAVHTVGSTIAVDARAYAQVRGVPNRQAGEDFYMMSKLVKLGPVHEPACAPLRIRARRSQRVPFGTGAATTEIVAARAAGRAYAVYDPRVYTLLGAWLDALAALADGDPAADISAEQAWGDALASAARARSLGPGERDALDRALHALAAPAAIAEARARTRSPRARRKRLDDWFDALRTLKLIHALRDMLLPSLPWHQALTRAPFLALDHAASASLAAQTPTPTIAELRALRRLLLQHEGAPRPP